MGRIAEALKRAQQERAKRLQMGGAEQEGFDEGGVAVMDGPPTENHGQSASDLEEPIRQTRDTSSFLVPPPSPRPFALTAEPIPPEAIGRDVIAYHEPASPFAEKYRSVRTRLLTSNPGGSTRIYAVTSTLRHEGKTVTTANLAFSLAELRHLRVAMIDLDFRQRGLTRLFGLDEEPGIAEVLRGDKKLSEICKPAGRSNLACIPIGQIGSDGPSDLLAGERVSAVFREIRERFHYTLIDTPPMNYYADIGLIGPLCHSVLVVVRMNHTPEPLLRRSVKMLQANQLAISGCVLAGYEDENTDYGDQSDFLTGPS